MIYGHVPYKGCYLINMVRWYDTLREIWASDKASRCIALFLMFFFMGTLVLILINTHIPLPYPLNTSIPTDVYAVIRLAFSMLLMVEVVGLIFIMADSTSLATGKQLEIMSLLLLREAFSDISLLGYSLVLERDWLIVTQVLMTSLAAIVLFIAKYFFDKWHHIQNYSDMKAYVNVKKCVSIFLLCSFLSLLPYDIYQALTSGEKSTFLRSFYTVLIFTDIFLVFIGQYYAPSFVSTFRNSGFAVSTLFMRIALGAPHYISALVCIFSALYLLLLSWVLMHCINTPEHAPK